METFTDTSFSSVTAGLGAIAVFSFLRSINGKTNKEKLSNGTASLINIIAFIHYLRMRKIWDDKHKDLVSTRYSDWFLTCPLLLFEFYILMEWIKVDEQTNKLSVDKGLGLPIVISMIATLSMLLCGFLSELYPEQKWEFYGLGFGCLLVLFSVLYMIDKKRKKDKSVPQWPWIFIGIWVLYGAAYLMENRDLFYNILDLIAKGAFAMCIALL